MLEVLFIQRDAQRGRAGYTDVPTMKVTTCNVLATALSAAAQGIELVIDDFPIVDLVSVECERPDSCVAESAHRATLVMLLRK